MDLDAGTYCGGIQGCSEAVPIAEVTPDWLRFQNRDGYSESVNRRDGRYSSYVRPVLYSGTCSREPFTGMPKPPRLF